MHRLHTVAGVIVAPFLIVAALTGFFYALAPSLETVVYHGELTATADSPARPLSEQVAAARAVHPDLPVVTVEPSADPHATTRVLFADDSLISSSYTRAVFVDPGDLSLHGDLVQYGSSRALPFRAWLSEGHRRLWLGEPGRIYSELAASWMGALSIVGMWLWFKRRKNGNSRRQRVISWHARAGLWLLPGLLFLTVTGLTWSMVAGGDIGQVRKQLDWVAPKPAVTVGAAAVADPHAGHSGHAGHAGHAGHGGGEASSDLFAQVDAVYRTAREQGLEGMLNLTPPAAPGEAWVASEAREPYKLHMDAVSVDGATGAVVDRVDFDSWPLVAKLTEWLINAHMGFLFGIWNQLALAAVALGLLGISLAGIWLWFARGRGRAPGRLAGPQGWLRLSGRDRAVLAALLLGYSVVAPLFGASLVVFFVAEWLLSHARARSGAGRPHGKRTPNS